MAASERRERFAADRAAYAHLDSHEDYLAETTSWEATTADGLDDDG